MVYLDRRTFLTAAGAIWLATSTRAWAGATQATGSLGDPDTFARRFGGTVFRPDSPDYARLSRVYYARSPARPALFAHCRSTDEVRRAVTAARESGESLAIRCGGHSYAGHSLSDGVVLDLSGLRRVSVARDGASVTVGGGALVGMIDQATAARGRATPLGVCPTVGIGGLALGGGVGALMGRRGLACDNLLSAEIVLADGSAVTASRARNRDLYWAIRGGGGNYGVATSFTFRLHETEQVLGGFITLRSPDPRDMIRLYGELCATAPDDLMLLATLLPDRERRPTLAIQVCHIGPAERASRDFAALAASPHVVDNQVRRLRYADLQAQGPSEIPVSRMVNRSGFRREMDDAAIETLTRAIANPPGPYFLGFVPLHGAVTRVETAASAFPLRRRGMAFGLSVIPMGPAGLAPAEAWIDALGRDLADPGAGAYVNVMDNQGTDAVRSAYGTNHARLARLKARYDPDNFFRHNQNIRPAA